VSRYNWRTGCQPNHFDFPIRQKWLSPRPGEAGGWRRPCQTIEGRRPSLRGYQNPAPAGASLSSDPGLLCEIAIGGDQACDLPDPILAQSQAKAPASQAQTERRHYLGKQLRATCGLVLGGQLARKRSASMSKFLYWAETVLSRSDAAGEGGEGESHDHVTAGA
jgi:hypothetical protein